MIPRLSIRAVWGREVFPVGDTVEIEVAIHNPGQQAMQVCNPSDPDNAELSFHIEGPGGPRTIRGAGSAAPRIPVEAGEVLRTDIALDQRTSLEPGDYTVSARLQLGAEVLESEAVHVKVFEPRTTRFAMPVGPQRGPSARPTSYVALVGDTVSLIHGHELMPSVEHEGDFDSLPKTRCADPPTVVDRLLSVSAPADAEAQWVAWEDATGLRARVDDAEVQGIAHAPLAGPHHVVEPLVRRPDGTVSAYVVTGEQSTLQECRFAAPVTEVEPATGPDDWDDEILVAGPVEQRDVGRMPLMPTASGALHDADRSRLVFVTPRNDGLVVMYADIRAGTMAASASALLPGAHPLPDISPVVTAGAEDGETLAHVMSWRPASESAANGAIPGSPAVELWSSTLRCSAAGTQVIDERRIGSAREPIRSAASAVSWDDTPATRPTVGFLDGAGVLHISKQGGPLVPTTPPETRMLPLALATSEDRTYLFVDTDRGPHPIVVPV
ncbi:MAG: hypothetical protein AAF799_25945 [Myxococcota bacterium]